METSAILLCIVLVIITILLWRRLRGSTPVSGLAYKWVLITGCDTGFGHQLAKRLDKLGLRVFAGCLSEGGEKNLQQCCSARLTTIRLDVTKQVDIEKTLCLITQEMASSSGSVLWAIVNNAGIGSGGPFDWITVQQMQRVFDVNVWGLLNVTKAFLPLLKKSCGRIVNVASCAGKLPGPGLSAYSASKYAVQSFSDALRIEMRPFGVSVHIIDPGFFKTNLTDAHNQKRQLEGLWNGLDQRVKDEYGEDFYLKGAIDFMGWFASSNTEEVVGAMEHAVTSCFPCVRYKLGWDHKLIWQWLAMLPSEIQDVFLGASFPRPAMCK
ncbi:predicted protein [Nematostella vectensis]|uniref:Uncharacterized protein n=1 Tax=Nematostella vectensis TaxID=45351 RepID=A7SKS9_NEMVE|nr:predicted protein [Nematostella vectensis]|eukprot:XP_001627771.1 predicted protein [Nematostella vectensis]